MYLSYNQSGCWYYSNAKIAQPIFGTKLLELIGTFDERESSKTAYLKIDIFKEKSVAVSRYYAIYNLLHFALIGFF